MAIRLGKLQFEGDVLLLINGKPVASGPMADMVKVAEREARAGDRLTFLEAGWEDDD